MCSCFCDDFCGEKNKCECHCCRGPQGPQGCPGPKGEKGEPGCNGRDGKDAHFDICDFARQLICLCKEKHDGDSCRCE